MINDVLFSFTCNMQVKISVCCIRKSQGKFAYYSTWNKKDLTGRIDTLIIDVRPMKQKHK